MYLHTKVIIMNTCIGSSVRKMYSEHETLQSNAPTVLIFSQKLVKWMGNNINLRNMSKYHLDGCMYVQQTRTRSYTNWSNRAQISMDLGYSIQRYSSIFARSETTHTESCMRQERRQRRTAYAAAHAADGGLHSAACHRHQHRTEYRLTRQSFSASIHDNTDDAQQIKHKIRVLGPRLITNCIQEDQRGLADVEAPLPPLAPRRWRRFPDVERPHLVFYFPRSCVPQTFMSSDLVILLAHRHQAEPSEVLLLIQLAAYRRATLQPTVDKYATWWDLDRRCTDVSSSRIQLGKLQVHRLICTHVLSCCIPDAIYSFF